MRPRNLAFPVAFAAAALSPAIAAAHAQTGVAGGFASGFIHPFLGPEHLVAMVAVGVWGAQLGMPLIAALPIAFPLMMSLGALLGVSGYPLPLDRYGVALSAVALGAAVFFKYRPPDWAAVGAVAVFAIFHGYAHGVALHPAQSPIGYALGFVMATGLLHLAGIGIGAIAVDRDWGATLTKACGAVVASVGAIFAVIAALATA